MIENTKLWLIAARDLALAIHGLYRNRAALRVLTEVDMNTGSI